MNLFDSWAEWMEGRTDRDVEFQVYQDWKKEREYYLNELKIKSDRCNVLTIELINLEEKYKELGEDLRSFAKNYLGIDFIS